MGAVCKYCTCAIEDRDTHGQAIAQTFLLTNDVTGAKKLSMGSFGTVGEYASTLG